jgi:hypothetical protein
MASGLLTICMHATPPSMNRIGYGGQTHWRAVRKQKHAWENDIIILLLAGRLPKGLSYVEARADLRFPSKRRRDEGNFRVLLEKATGDALVTGGWLEDDDSTHFRFSTVTFEAERGAARTLLHIRWES